MIELRHLSKRFDEKPVLDDFSHDLAEGVTTCIMGPSGCGKTTLLQIMAGFLPADGGSVRGLERQRLSFVWQENRLLPWRRALENITLCRVEADRARHYLEAVGLAAEADKLPGELSGGMARRLAIARALAYGGDCYFLDEPLQGLDAATRAKMIDLLKDELRGKTAFVVTHDRGEAELLGDRILTAQGLPFRVAE